MSLSVWLLCIVIYYYCLVLSIVLWLIIIIIDNYSTVYYTIIIYPFFILCQNMKYDHPKSLNKNKKTPNITTIYQKNAHKSPKNLRHRFNGHPQTIQAPSTAPWGPQRCHWWTAPGPSPGSAALGAADSRKAPRLRPGDMKSLGDLIYRYIIYIIYYVYIDR